MMMPQLKPLAVNRMAAMAAVCCTTAVYCTTAVATPAIAQPTFADLCEAYQGISSNWSSLLYGRSYAWQTVEALMAAIPVSNCQRAESWLAAVDSLWGPQLQTTYLPTNGLMVDFPIGVDLQMIAIATPNLTDLNLSGHVIPDLAPITALDQLHTLRVANTQLQDISPLTALTQLTTLDISYNQIHSIASVGNIPTLRSLNASYNPFTDISPIGKILIPAVEQEWQLLDLSGIAIDSDTCPDNLGDICDSSSEGDF
ncbi:leucine-rich repeat domain-containing protein [Leptothoe sp. PORK10 BA2]|uniref:leucine-rich repeat domain-containing protein n=1 Tax=Leptothoe sp. PORK10 BA2 TaxID=3110254 RepID=UPI002B20AE3B|nr:leucine-rich repeat domain-containing protein [Leptothoe sp. PORK10 BA2]MEA5466632.1 leucine-rich repeat domain-containing protein [Leptothoe sp. PORK10 BA2]